MRVLFVIVFSSLVAPGCASTAWIESRPHGAEVTMDGEPLGQTPIVYKEMVWIWTNHELTFEKAGYERATAVLTAERPLTIRYMAACLCTAGLLLPVALAADYDEPRIVVRLRESSPEREASAAIRPEQLSRGLDFRP